MDRETVAWVNAEYVTVIDWRFTTEVSLIKL